MESVSYDLLQLIHSLARVENRQQIIDLYTKAMMTFLPGTQFFHTTELIQNIDDMTEIVNLSASRHQFGYVVIKYNNAKISNDIKAVVRNSIKLVGLLLENHKQKEWLASEKKRLQEAVDKQIKSIRHHEEQYKALAENSEDIIIRISRELVIDYVNTAFEKITEIDRSQVIGKKLNQISLIGNRAREWEKAILAVFDHGNHIRQDISYSKNKQKHILDLRIYPENSDEGEFIYCICSLRDITEFKTKEEELKNAKLKAEEADRLKSAFLANMSHEIRTPLNAILGFSELLKRRDLPFNKREFYSGIINNNGKQLLQIISDIIDLSKIEAGQIKLEESQVNLMGLFAELKEQFQNEILRINKKQLQIVIKNTPENTNLVIIADETRLTQIFNNLLGNALKFTDQGEISFGFHLEANDLIFYVQDTGIGLKPEYQSVIFERFRQVNETSSREYGGTGLGLSISKHLVELMGGKIWLESLENEGTVFYFSLPLKITSKNEEPIIEEIETPLNLNLKGKRILIAEDDLPSFQYLEAILEDTLAQIIHVDNGEDAVKLSQQLNPDLVIMDIQLPKLNGIEAVKKIRMFNPSVKIIALTANAFDEDRQLSLSIGCNDYLSKPLEKDVFLRTIALYLE